MKFEIIQDIEQLRTFCLDVATRDWLVVDTEFIRENTYFPNLCLIQIAYQDRAVCIDALAIDDLSVLYELVTSKSTLKVFHAASQDLEIFFNLFSEIPVPIFDTQIAASALGYGEQVSYAQLVKEVCGITLDKSLSRTAWDKRPLSSNEIQYALDDVKYLAEIYQHLEKGLLEKNRRHWVESEFQRLTDINNYKVSSNEVWKYVKGAGKLQPSQLNVLKFLAEWRDTQARIEDKPRQWILRDKTLRVLSQEQPTTTAQLSEIKEISSQQCNKYTDDIIECIKKAHQIPEKEWPKTTQLKPLTREQRKLVKNALQFIRKRAEELEISPNLLATRSSIEKLIRGQRELQILQDWRQDLVGNDLVKLLEENCAI